MSVIDPIYIGQDAVAQLIAYCEQNQLTTFNLVADENTWRAAGEMVAAALNDKGYDVNTIVLTGDEIIADAHYLTEVLMAAPVEKRMFIAVGSGTVTDITRVVSHRTHNDFISFPTAPSVDGFASIGAPLVLNGVKQTVISQTPVALFADLKILTAAPQELIAAGFGDLLGKITSSADWQLGRLLWNEPFDDSIAKRSLAAVEKCAPYAAEIGQGSEEGVRRLLDGLIETGQCMIDFGNSRPASGAEHHCSHFWEMKLLREGRRAILHGAKVGVATILIAQKYERIRNLSRDDVLERLEGAELPNRDAEIALIRAAYGDGADEVMAIQQPFLDLTEAEFDQMKHKIVEHWDELQSILALVPPADEVRQMLANVGAATDGTQLGLSEDEIEAAQQNGHWLRNRFTVVKLERMFNLG